MIDQYELGQANGAHLVLVILTLATLHRNMVVS